MSKVTNHYEINRTFHKPASAFQISNKAHAGYSLRISMLLSAITIITAFMTTHAHADENLYEKNYKAQNVYNLVSMQANPDTKMYVSNHQDEDNISMLENGYDMMGSSGFEAGNVPADLALQHAKSIKADVVLVYTKYGSSRTASSKMQLIKEAVKSGKALTEKDMADDATIYKYYASYWAKMPPPTLGVHIIKLVPKSSNGELADTNAGKGLKVLAVIKDSPAFKAGFLRGDQLLSINDKLLENPEDLTGYVSKNHGETVNIQYLRDDQQYSKQVKLN